MFNSILSADTALSFSIFIKVILSSLILGLGISLIYILTHKREGYMQSYVITLIMLPAIVAIIIMLVGDNAARALSLAGAFALVRFRSEPGDPKDISYVFFALGVGLSIGLGYIGYAVVFLAFIAAVMAIIYITKFGEPSSKHMTLKITIPENLNYVGLFDEILDEYTLSWNLRKVKTIDFGSLFDLVYGIQIKNTADQKKFIDKLRTLNGNLNITLVLSKNENMLL